MLVPKKDRLIIYSHLFKEGVMTARKSFSGKHHDLEVPNLHVLKLMQSLHSRGLLTYKFSWQWFFYILTDEGIAYLREYLHLSADTVPNTLKKSGKVQAAPSFATGRVEGESGVIYPVHRERSDREGREGYRSKDSSAPTDFNPEYQRGDGAGRGRGRGGFRGRGRGGVARGGSRIPRAAAPAETAPVEA